MEGPVNRARYVWEPLTMGGVAGFGGASLGRLLLVQAVVAMMVAASVVWFLQRAWFPTIGEAIRRLPIEGEIRSGRLDWREQTAVRLGEGRFLGLTVDLEHSGAARMPAHVQVEFGRSDVRIISLFGYVGLGYPKGWVVAFNREELEPRWGAWAPAILAITAVLVVSGLMAIWGLLATLYSVPAWLVGFYADREVSLGGSWRLAGAALMPGALFMSGAILLYGLGVLDVVHLVVAGGAHLVIGWIYVVVSPFYLPRQGGGEVARNPFAGGGLESKSEIRNPKAEGNPESEGR